MQSLNIILTKTTKEDLHTLFEFQLNLEANYLAAFTSIDPTDKTAYIEKYSKHIADPNIRMFTIIINNEIAGSIARFFIVNDAEITYWINRSHWGKGIASTALQHFLKSEKIRPIFARTAFDNYGSQKVLKKNGFLKIGTDKGFANARKTEIEEFIYKLE